MEFLRLNKGDFDNQLLSLWQEAFGEEKEAILPFFREIFPLCHAFGAVEADTVCAVIYALPQRLKLGEQELPFCYLYAIATKKSHRGQGLASRLMAYVGEVLASMGYMGLILVPASESLFDFYKKLGFSVFCKRNTVEIRNKVEDFTVCNEEEYLRKREEYLEKTPHNVPPAQVLRHLKKFSWQGGCAAGEETAQGFVFRELLGEESAPVVARAMTAEEKIPYAVVKALDPRFPTQGYFSFAME